MLPTYPKVVAARAKQNSQRIKRIAQQKSGFLGDIASHQIHEGSATDIVRVDGRADRTEMQTNSAEITIKHMKIDDISRDVVEGYLEQIADQLGEQMSTSVLQAVSAGAESVGNIVEAKGPLTPEILLKSFETIELSFDSDGQWEPPKMVVGPEMFEHIKLLKESGAEEKYKKHLEEIIARKKIEHYRREAGRILAG